MDNFFTLKKCQRCNQELKCRTTSWFTEETICDVCSREEDHIKKQLELKKGHTFEGCGLHITQLRAMVK